MVIGNRSLFKRVLRLRLTIMCNRLVDFANKKKESRLTLLRDPPGLTCDPVGLISFTELLTHAKLLCLRGLSIVIVLSLNVLNLGTFLVAHLVAH